MFKIDNIKINVPCPKCKYLNKVSFLDISQQKAIICGGCLEQIKLIDKDESVKKSSKDIKSSLDELSKTIKNISK